MQYGASCAQGEVIEQQFGEKELCFRTLDLYTSAVLEASLNPTTSPKPEWRGAMDLMSEVSNLSFGGQPAALHPASSHGLLQHQLQACCNKGLWLVATPNCGLANSSCCTCICWKPSSLSPCTACAVEAIVQLRCQ